MVRSAGTGREKMKKNKSDFWTRGVGQYQDIIDLPRPVSVRHGGLSREQRAAQFAPFAALTGHNAAVKRTASRNVEAVEHFVERIEDPIWEEAEWSFGKGDGEQYAGAND